MEKNKIKIAFFGTPDFVTHVLDALARAELMPTVIVTRADKPAGRGLELRQSPVKIWGEGYGIPVLQPEVLDADFVSSLKAETGNLTPDLFIVAGYGKIIPQEILDIPKHGTLNVHPSLLPKYRGPSPIEQQILDDARTVGVSVILLDEETDHGPIVAQNTVVPETWPMMRENLENLLWTKGGELLADAIPKLIDRTLEPKEQNHVAATFTPKLTKEDGQLDLSDDPYKNYLKYCAYQGWPGTFFYAERGGMKIRVKIVRAEFAKGEFRPLRVIPEGKKEMDYVDTTNK
jgi:methionyl-tRNA formyltransferase